MDQELTGDGLEMHKMLAISTAHLTKETLSWLKEQSNTSDEVKIVVYEKVEYGFFIPSYDDLKEDAQHHADLLSVINLAEDQGCTWIMIDRDIPITDELPVFE